jgi:hypothetical protein
MKLSPYHTPLIIPLMNAGSISYQHHQLLVRAAKPPNIPPLNRNYTECFLDLVLCPIAFFVVRGQHFFNECVIFIQFNIDVSNAN